MNTVCLIYGFAEGPRISGRMRRELRQHGYKTVKTPNNADILIAHSGGCYMLPREHSAKLVVFIDPPMWPGRSLLGGLPTKVRIENRNGFWWRKTALNLWYFFSRFGKWSKMAKFIKLDSLHANEAKVIFVRNRNDSFTHPGSALDCVAENQWNACSIDGGHDDMWENPVPYVALITQLYDEHGVAVG